MDTPTRCGICSAIAGAIGALTGFSLLAVYLGGSIQFPNGISFRALTSNDAAASTHIATHGAGFSGDVATKGVSPRYNIDDFVADAGPEYDLYIQCQRELMGKSSNDPLSYYQLASKF